MLMQHAQTQKVVTRANVKLGIKEMESSAQILTSVLQTTEDVMPMLSVQTLKVVTPANVNLDTKEMENNAK